MGDAIIKLTVDSMVIHDSNRLKYPFHGGRQLWRKLIV